MQSKDVLALGEVIVKQLKLNQRGDVLQRWLAHHLAELILNAENSEGDAKERTEAQAVETILKLWVHRRALPEQVDPLGGFRDAISVMERLNSGSDQSSFQQYAIPHEQTLRDMFGTLCRIALEAILFTQIKQAREITSDELAALGDDEIAIYQLFTTWLEGVKEPERLPIINFVFTDVYSKTEDNDDSDQTTIAVKPDDQAKDDLDANRAILENLERMHTDLGKLIAFWKTNSLEKTNEDFC